MDLELSRAVIVALEIILDTCESIDDLVFIAQTTSDACGNRTWGSSVHSGIALLELIRHTPRGQLF